MKTSVNYVKLILGKCLYKELLKIGDIMPFEKIVNYAVQTIFSLFYQSLPKKQ